MTVLRLWNSTAKWKTFHASVLSDADENVGMIAGGNVKVSCGPKRARTAGRSF